MAPDHETIRQALRGVTAPGTTLSLEEAGALRRLEVDGSSVRLSVALAGGTPAGADAVKAAVRNALEPLDGVERVDVEVTVAPAPRGPSLPQAGAPGPQVGSQAAPTWADRIAGVQHVVAVASGKGGVGKSTVAANLALALAGLGHRVGLLDADIYGPSQQLMFGGGQPMATAQGKILPVSGPAGVKMMSLGLIVEADQPVIWRGPMLMKALEQFVGDVEWGELDELVVDLPPGTGDVSITLCQNVPVSGAVIVTTPQDVALIDARKGLAMFSKMDVPVLGIVENMSHFTCPSCGHVEHIFGRGGGERTAAELGVPFLGGIPLDPEIVSGGDAGRPIVLERPESEAARAFARVAEAVAASLG